ncbi:uncharacterized protein LOC121732119 [Aricia agestis]|uniref:uncharacterized protein LOC121732119 n=1 Tax=Aricia agestis TaxID=91739 RepID=UPI001C20279C|nr:uncharacterized protein LOC121732119 [Aricia agestis]
MGRISLFLSVSLSVTLCSSHVVWSDTSQLQPVQGLYIKPSADGTTGDLFVAATENTGTKSQWLTDQPINFLPAASQLQPTAALPVTLTSTLAKATSQEETGSTQKRAPATPVTPPINYAYALPFPTSTDGNVLAPCPYAVAANAEGGTPAWPEGTQYSAFQHFYPQMMAAMSRAMTTFAGAEAKDKGAAALSVPPYWPQAYSYPYQYLMVDPNAWAQTQKEATTQKQTENSDESS